jgi:hypothetical protein
MSQGARVDLDRISPDVHRHGTRSVFFGGIYWLALWATIDVFVCHIFLRAPEGLTGLKTADVALIRLNRRGGGRGFPREQLEGRFLER